jgi:hypothetical protein
MHSMVKVINMYLWKGVKGAAGSIIGYVFFGSLVCKNVFKEPLHI